MKHGKVIVVGQRTPFARYLEKMGVSVFEAVKRFPGVQETSWHDCEAVYWTMEAVCSIHLWHQFRIVLLNIPVDSIRILDFKQMAPSADNMHFVKESLKYCDLLKIDGHEFLAVCNLLGLASQHMFDNGFELMRQYCIKTLILTHGTRGCHVFHGSSVSEKWGLAGLDETQSEEAEAAFLASYYVASRQPGRLFTECHRMAFDYMKKQYEND